MQTKQSILNEPKEKDQSYRIPAWGYVVCPLILPVIATLPLLMGWNGFITIFETNVIFYVMVVVGLITAVCIRVNKMKFVWLIGLTCMVVEAYLYNSLYKEGYLLADLVMFENGFSSVWGKILIVLTVYMAVVGVRVSRWSQTGWDEIWELKRESHRENCKQKQEVFMERGTEYVKTLREIFSIKMAISWRSIEIWQKKGKKKGKSMRK